MTQSAPELVLYHRSGCHLCDEMHQELERWRSQYRFSLRLVDVDDSQDLQQRYGELVPVLAGSDGIEVCHYFVDDERLQRYLSVS